MERTHYMTRSNGDTRICTLIRTDGHLSLISLKTGCYWGDVREETKVVPTSYLSAI